MTAHGAGAFANLYYITLTEFGFPSLPTVSGAVGQGWGLVSGAGEPETPALDTAFVYVATGY